MNVDAQAESVFSQTVCKILIHKKINGHVQVSGNITQWQKKYHKRN